MLWFSDCPVFDHCQDSWSVFFCPFVTCDARVEGSAQQNTGREVTLSSERPGDVKFNQDAGNWSSFWSSRGTEIYVSFPNGRASILSEEPLGRGRALKEEQNFLLKVEVEAYKGKGQK